MQKPLANSLLSASKKYLNALSKMVDQLSIDRYHYVLVLIDFHEENLSQKALAEILHIDKSYMVNILDYLEKKEYVIREKNPFDRREQLIRLTPKAKKDIPVIIESIEELNNRSLQNISESKKQIFNEVLGMIQDNLIKIEPKENKKPHTILKNYN
jgi:MarR family transcriptional regulator for hemolysin